MISILDLTNGYNQKSSFFTVLDNVELDFRVQGFKTLYVEGREEIEFFNDVAENNAIDGGVLINTNIKRQEIRIRFKIAMDDDSKLNEEYKRLKLFLCKKGERRTLKFPDEKGIRYVYFDRIENVENLHLCKIADIVFLQIDPKTYGESRIITGSTNITCNNIFLEHSVIESIKLTPKSNGESLKITNLNNANFIRIDTVISKGQVFEIFPEDQIVLRNNVDIRDKLDLRSYLEEFRIRYNDKIQTNINCDIEIKFREWWL